jgi:DNA polymerase
MIIDYSVSINDDKLNSYYTGNNGDKLKKMIQNVLDLRLEEVFYTHAIKCKPLNSNKPSDSEWESCKNHLFTQIEFIKPKVIVALGEDVYNRLMNVEDGFESVRGHVIEYNGSKLIPIYHPSYLVRNPDFKKTTYNDLITIKNCL